MKYLNNTEKEAVRQVIALAKEWGYGNLIDRLHAAWTLKGLRDYPHWDIKSCMMFGHMGNDSRMGSWPKMDRKNLIKELADYVGEEP